MFHICNVIYYFMFVILDFCGTCLYMAINLYLMSQIILYIHVFSPD